MPINLHPQYITNDDGKRVSVILSIEEFNELIENQVDDLSYLSDEIEKGFNSPLLTKNHKEVFAELRQRYVQNQIFRNSKPDLIDIFDLIAKDKPSVALEYIDKLETTIDLLSTNPRLGVECKNKNINKDCRILVFENYLIFYKFIDNEIQIARILNNRVDYSKIV